MTTTKDLSLAENILQLKQERNAVILAHNYQRDEVQDIADFTGDSLELSRKVAELDEEIIVFCGVHFMAESADILSGPEQTVYMPETAAGCPMADMATAELMQGGWDRLNGVCDEWRPVVYVNSTARIKALCGRHGGSTCTSSNARRVFEWALNAGQRVFFLPDEHLGRNTAAAMGIPDQEVALYNPACADGGLSDDEIRRARVMAQKIPERLEVIDCMPRNPTGKILKQELRARFE